MQPIVTIPSQGVLPKQLVLTSSAVRDGFHYKVLGLYPGQCFQNLNHRSAAAGVV